MTRARKSDGYTIGITVFVNADGSLGLFENGLRQNVLFLHQLFKAAKGCRKVFLLNHGDAEPATGAPELGIGRDSIVRTHTVIDQLDYVLSVGAAMDAETVAALRQRGCKIVSYKGGNGGVISMEASVAQPPRPDAERYFDRAYFDAIWMTPQHIHTYRGWCETLYRCPVYEVPQVWAPTTIEALPADVRGRFNYQACGGAWRIGVMDPNITVMKTSHMPMLVCEAAFRRDPATFKAIYVTNALQFREDPHFVSFTGSLRATKAGVLTIEPRFVGIEFLANHADAVVTHQWENGLNYLYYEVLYGGRPLVHNSPFLRDFGYYYPDFEAERGADALLRAFAEHDAGLEAYNRHNLRLFDRLSPVTPDNIQLHQALLASL